MIEALDDSPEMVAAAKKRGVDATISDLRSWRPQRDTDVVVSNAVLHWVPEHPELSARWTGQLAGGAWLAIQMPGNFEYALACRGPRGGAPGAFRKYPARRAISSGCGGAPAHLLRRTRRCGPDVPSTRGRPLTCTS